MPKTIETAMSLGLLADMFSDIDKNLEKLFYKKRGLYRQKTELQPFPTAQATRIYLLAQSAKACATFQPCRCASFARACLSCKI